MAPGASSTNSGIREFYAPLTTAETSQQSMPASSINHDIREFYAPRTTEPLTSRQQSMPRVEHQTSQRPIKPHTLHNSTNRTRPDDDHQVEAGCLGEIKNYKAGDEFVLLWKWVDDFMDKRRAKKNSSKSHNVNKSTTSQLKPTPSSSRAAHQVPRPVVTPSPEAVRRQAIDREDMREYKTQRHTPWGELSHLYQSWRDQQAKKKADRAKQRKAEEIARGQAPNRKADAPRGRSINQREPPQNTPSPPGQHPQPGAAGKPNPAYNKKRGEVQKHTVKIAQLPPVHNSVHLQHTPSNNYRTRPSPDRGQKDRPTRDTRFSDFLHHRHAPPSQKPAPSRDTQWTYAVPGQDDELVRNSRFSSVLDPAKDFKKAKEAEKAKGPTCYICGCSDCAGGYRDIISRLWVCAACQKNEGIEPVQCAVCGEPSSPDSGYAGNGLWMCSSCRDPTTPKELPPSPKLAREDRSKGESEESEHFLRRMSASHASLPSDGIPISEYDSDHLYSDDGWEPQTATALPQKPIGLGILFHDSEEEEQEEAFRPTPPLKDSKYYQDSPTLPAMDYNQSYLRKPGAKHPYAPSSPAPPPPTTTRKPSIVSFTHDLPKTKPSSKKPHQRPPQPPSFNPTTYPYPSPPSTPPPPPHSLHRPRPASSVYPTDEHSLPDFPYPPPPIPQKYVNKPQRSSSVTPDMLSKAALARSWEPMASPRSQSSPVGVEEGGRTVLNRRSSWYDFWKPVFEPRGEGRG